MARNPADLYKAAALCRGMAGTCHTDEARDALQEVARDLDDEADRATAGEEHPDVLELTRNAMLFRWPA